MQCYLFDTRIATVPLSSNNILYLLLLAASVIKFSNFKFKSKRSHRSISISRKQLL